MPHSERLPHVNPVGIVEVPEDFDRSPRRYPLPTRLFAGALLAFFFAATVVTGALSLGAYCLTTDGGDVRQLHENVRRLVPER